MRLSFWTEERVARFKELHTTSGLSFGQIARELGCSRNAVIGKARRMGLAAKPRVHNPTSNKPGRRYTRAPWAVPHLLANGKTRRYLPATEGILSTDLPPEKVANPVSMVDLERHHCRWPVSGEPRDMLFCGAEAFPKYPYCRHHCAIVYRTPGERMTRAEFEEHGRKLAKNYQQAGVKAA